LEVRIDKRIIRTLQKYPEKSREIIFSHIRRLEDPYKAADVECLHGAAQVYRMHIGRTYTIIFRIHKEENLVQVLDLLTIEQAHKKYPRYY
jgi:mRNA-degrading endonuclease RelE of RelBE toxin-antitoxin system